MKSKAYFEQNKHTLKANINIYLTIKFNKLEALLSWAPILATKPPWRINLPWAMQSFTQGGLGQSFAKCPLLSQLKHLTLDRSRFTFFDWLLFGH